MAELENNPLQFVVDEEGTNTHVIITSSMYEALMESLEHNLEDTKAAEALQEALENSQMIGNAEGTITHMLVVSDLFDRIMTALDTDDDEDEEE